MSDHSISIVPQQSSYPDNKNKATEIIQWLISLDVIKPVLSDCILSPEHGYAVSTGATYTTRYPEQLRFDLLTNGLEIITVRQVFDTGENGMEELICPHCGENIAGEDWDFLNEWYSAESNNITCPLCNTGTDIHQFKFVPEWGFSDLGFTFWNWPEFSDAFISAFEERLGTKISMVYAHI